MKLVAIAAVGKNLELGLDNDLPWRLPKDFKRFKALTSFHYIIMGRKTFESFPKPLPNRTHVIITRQENYKAEHCLVVNSLDEALKIVKDEALVYVIGGGEIYSQFMPYLDEIELTRVDGEFTADTYFPHIDLNNWELFLSEEHPKDEKHNYNFTFESYRRKHLD